MNRWLLTAAGIAVAGSAFAASGPRTPSAAHTHRPSAPSGSPMALPRATVARSSSGSSASGAPAVTIARSLANAAVPSSADTPAEPAPMRATPAPAPRTTEPPRVEEREVEIQIAPRGALGADQEIEVEVDPRGTVIQKRFSSFNPTFSAYGLTDALPPAFRKAISLELSDATLKEAIEAVVKQLGSGISVSYDKDATSDARLSLKVKQVSAASLLGLITQNAGLRWSVSANGPKGAGQLRISKGGRGSFGGSLLSDGYVQSLAANPAFLDVLVEPGNGWTAARQMIIGEQRLTLECPHCKSKSTIIRQRHQPKCPKCTRTFQNDWQFCPADGTKRPVDPNEWKFCPSCGKKIEIEKAAEEGSIPVLSDLPVLGELFVRPSRDAGAAPNAFAPKPPTAPAPLKVLPPVPAPAPPVQPGATPSQLAR